MGNHISRGSSATGKVILLDGSIQEFEKPLTVAELMVEYPQQMVVDLKTSTQKKATPLPADKTLELHKIYLMVPVRNGKLAHLSPQQAHHILLRVNAMLMASSSKFLPLITKICPSTKFEDALMVPKEVFGFEGRKMEGGDDGLDVVERPDYLSRQVSGRNWKPNLDTIEEKKYEMKKTSNWIIVAKRIHSKGLIWG